MARRPPIHKRIRAHLDAAGITPADVQRETGWHELRVWRLLTGRTKLTVDDLEAVARVLGKTPGELFDPPRASAS